jgi:hypothetical protein
MGYSSYLCAHCGRPVISEDAVDPGINEWMAEVVMMDDGGSRQVVLEYSGYAGQYEEFALNGSVWVHKACWEMAGKPEFEAYEGPSDYDPGQGFGGKECLVIDPRITDEAERARLLEAGMKVREQRQYDCAATTVGHWFAEREYPPWDNDPWKQRYSYFEGHAPEDYVLNEDGEFLHVREGAVQEGTHWYVSDKLKWEQGELNERHFEGTEDELKAHLAAEWARFVESDECKAYLARAEERFR